MRKVTRRAVCAGLVAAPTAMAVGISSGTAGGSVQGMTPAAAQDVIGRVIEVVAQHEGVSAETMLSPLRTREAVAARRKALYLAYRMSGKSLPEIGRRFGGRDHTTVLHAVRTMETQASADPIFQAELTGLARAAAPDAEALIAKSEARFARYA
jgi:chromosomal replication initiator protein